MTNPEIAQILTQTSDMLQLLGANRFRYLAFSSAAETVRDLGTDIGKVEAEGGKLEELPNIGKGIAEHIRDLLESGSFAEYDELRAQIPPGVVEMLAIPEVGPKTAKRLWQELDITSVEQLKHMAEVGEIQKLKGFGAKSEQKMLKNIELMAQRGDDRISIGRARPLAQELVQALQEALPDGKLAKIEVMGSLRRWRETIGDLDLLAVSDDAAAVMEAFRSLPQVSDVVVSGATKSSVVLANGMQVDLRVVEARHWGAALQYFTGNLAHNRRVRNIALRRGWSLNEYNLVATGKGDAKEGEEKFFEDEASLYEFLGMAWIPPVLREDRGEIEAAQTNKLPDLITLADIQGELHGHTTWSDGTASIAEMAAAARARGYGYWNVSDHSAGLGMVNGLDEERIQQQAAEIQKLNEGWASEGVDFRLLRGTELEILADGTLGLPDDVIAELDVVVASIHSGLRQDRETITERCLKAVRNPHVDILGHPTGRLIGTRPPSDLDVERVLEVCAETGTVVEINASPYRLDLNDVWARRAVELGCKIAISSDAHAPDNMELMIYGIGTAQRAWIMAADVINTRPVDEMLGMLKDGASK